MEWNIGEAMLKTENCHENHFQRRQVRISCCFFSFDFFFFRFLISFKIFKFSAIFSPLLRSCKMNQNWISWKYDHHPKIVQEIVLVLWGNIQILSNFLLSECKVIFIFISFHFHCVISPTDVYITSQHIKLINGRNSIKRVRKIILTELTNQALRI